MKAQSKIFYKYFVLITYNYFRNVLKSNVVLLCVCNNVFFVIFSISTMILKKKYYFQWTTYL